MIYNPQTAPFGGLYLRSVESASSVLAVEPVTMLVRSVADIEAAMTAFARQPGGGVVAIPDSFTVEHRDVLVALAARHGLPAIYAYMQAPSIGGLMAYTVDTRDLMHRAAGYIDRILKGAKPAELAVQQPARFNLVINIVASGVSLRRKVSPGCPFCPPVFLPDRSRRLLTRTGFFRPSLEGGLPINLKTAKALGLTVPQTLLVSADEVID